MMNTDTIGVRVCWIAGGWDWADVVARAHRTRSEFEKHGVPLVATLDVVIASADAASVTETDPTLCRIAGNDIQALKQAARDMGCMHV